MASDSDHEKLFFFHSTPDPPISPPCESTLVTKHTENKNRVSD